MKYKLLKRPKSPRIIVGFPSIGLVSTIATKFLLDHLETQQIGYLESEKMLPLTAIHKSKIVEPLTLFYNKKYNIIVLQSLTDVAGLEWEITDTLLKLAKELNAKEIIMLEGIPMSKLEPQQKLNLFFYSNREKPKNVPSVSQLKEGIIMGVTAAVLLKSNYPVTCLFSETHSALPDSESAAHIIEALDEYLGLNLDFKPLLAQAKKFEDSLKQYLGKNKEAMDTKQKRELSYFG